MAVVVLAVAGTGLWWWSRVQEQRVLEAYAQVFILVEPTREPGASAEDRATAISALEGVLALHPAGNPAARAALELGNLRFAERQYDRARTAWEIALARGGSRTVQTLARAGIAASWEAEGDFRQAVAAFRTAVESVGPQDFLYDQLLVDLARAQELAGLRDEAVETYRRLLTEVPTSARADDVRIRLAALGIAS
jgi:tetratricopeptide (TPR) repeat protein